MSMCLWCAQSQRSCTKNCVMSFLLNLKCHRVTFGNHVLAAAQGNASRVLHGKRKLPLLYYHQQEHCIAHSVSYFTDQRTKELCILLYLHCRCTDSYSYRIDSPPQLSLLNLLFLCRYSFCCVPTLLMPIGPRHQEETRTVTSSGPSGQEFGWPQGKHTYTP